MKETVNPPWENPVNNSPTVESVKKLLEIRHELEEKLKDVNEQIAIIRELVNA